MNLADLAAAWQFLAIPKVAGEADPIIARRKTCADLAQVAMNLGFIGGDAKHAIPVWEAWVSAFIGSSDPRHVSMATTFNRRA